MSQYNFDDEWSSSSSDNQWHEDGNDSFSQPKKTIKIKFKINPKILTFVAVGTVLVIIVASSIPRIFKRTETTKIALPTTSASPSTQSQVDLYTQPKSLQLFIDNALASSVTIFCGNYSGSGWAIDLSDDMSSSRDDAYPTEIITNNHVIEGCENSGVAIVPMGTQSKYDAYVYSYDRDNDLAVLMTSKYLTPFATVQPGNEPKVGQWVMAVGSPGAGSTTLDGSITTGTITNLREQVVITDTTINPGNSGGPLLNAAGQVIAVVSAKIVQENVNNIGIAIEVSLICEQLNGCSKKRLLK